MKINQSWSFIVTMAIAYIRPDKHFGSAFDQLKLIKSYAYANDVEITEKFIEQAGGNDKEQRHLKATQFFRAHPEETVVVADIWVFGENIEEITQSLNCLFKNDLTIHLVQKSVVVTKDSSAMFVLGLLDNARQMFLQTKEKRVGRPKGSLSSSKFDIYLDEIMGFIEEGKSVSEMARLLGVSRSSLKDYIESRELKKIAKENFLLKKDENKELEVIKTVQCPDEIIEEKQLAKATKKGEMQ